MTRKGYRMELLLDIAIVILVEYVLVAQTFYPIN